MQRLQTWFVDVPGGCFSLLYTGTIELLLVIALMLKFFRWFRMVIPFTVMLIFLQEVFVL